MRTPLLHLAVLALFASIAPLPVASAYPDDCLEASDKVGCVRQIGEAAPHQVSYLLCGETRDCVGYWSGEVTRETTRTETWVKETVAETCDGAETTACVEYAKEIACGSDFNCWSEYCQQPSAKDCLVFWTDHFWPYIVGAPDSAMRQVQWAKDTYGPLVCMIGQIRPCPF